jgi:hypothetical protein
LGEYSVGDLGGYLAFCAGDSLFQGGLEQCGHGRCGEILALIRWSMHQPGWSWLNVILGIWLVISPFVLFVSGAAMWNNVILGIIIAASALSLTYFKESPRA